MILECVHLRIDYPDVPGEGTSLKSRSNDQHRLREHREFAKDL